MNAVLGDYGFEKNTSEWQDILYLGNDEMSLTAITNDVRTFTTASQYIQNGSRASLNSNIEKVIIDSYHNGNIQLKSDGTVVYQCEYLSEDEMTNVL